MSEITITIKLDVSPAVEKLIDQLASAQYQYNEDFDDDDEDEAGTTD